MKHTLLIVLFSLGAASFAMANHHKPQQSSRPDSAKVQEEKVKCGSNFLSVFELFVPAPKPVSTQAQSPAEKVELPRDKSAK